MAFRQLEFAPDYKIDCWLVMIDSITIQNLRCFEDTTIKGFGLVNLIGGKNNSGKTVLLEAILINQQGSISNINYIQNLRGERYFPINNEFDKFWDSLFFSQKTDNQIIIRSTHSNSVEDVVNINCEIIGTELIENDEVTSDYSDTLRFINNKKLIIDFLSTKKDTNTILQEGSSWTDLIDFKNIHLNNKKANFFNAIHPISLLSSRRNINTIDTAKKFDRLYESKNYEDLLKALNIIDHRITAARTSISSGRPRIMILTEDNQYIHIGLFGDAISKILEITIELLSNKNGILLIDEIENGIHHSNQKEFWSHIIKIAKKFNVQVFATTHSEEMIKALNEASLDTEYQNDVRYFELIRHTKTNKIKGLAIDMPMLQIKLLTNTPHRGE